MADKDYQAGPQEEQEGINDEQEFIEAKVGNVTSFIDQMKERLQNE